MHRFYDRKPALLFLLFICGIAGAVENSVSVLVDHPKTFVGSEIQVSVLAIGSELDEPPELPPIKGLQSRFIDQQVTLNLNKKAFMHRYVCVADKPGKILIPPISATVDGHVLKSKPVELQIHALEKTDRLKLTATLSKTKIYVSEPVLLTVTWESSYPLHTVKAVDLSVPALRDKRFSEITKTVGVGAHRTVGLPVNNSRIIAKAWEKKEGARTLYFLEFHKVLVPHEPGTFDIAPARLVCSVLKAQPKSGPPPKNQRGRRWNQYPSYFNNDFFLSDADANRNHRFLVTSKSMKIEVAPLPREDRPPSFSGIIGSFKITASATPVDAKVGTPITLKLRVTEHPFVETIDLPSLRSLPELARNFYIPKQRSPGLVQKDGKEFTQTLRPTNERVQRIPPIRIPYFDPKTGTYAFVQSEQIALKVRKNPEFTEFDLDFSDGSAVKNDVQENPDGVYFNYTDLSFNDAGAGINLYSGASFLTVLAIPPLALLIWAFVIGYLRKLRHPSAILRARKAYRHFKRMPLGNPNQVDVAIRRYFAERCGLQPASVTPADIEAAIKDAPQRDDILAPIREFYRCYDREHYGNDAEQQPPKANAEGIRNAVKRVEGLLKRGLFLLLFLALAGPALADGPDAMLKEAQRLFDQAQPLSETDLDGALHMYRNAAMRFEKLSASAGTNRRLRGRLLYNAGNAYFRADDLGHAILCYRRAMRYIPYDRQLHRNLAFVRGRRTDVMPSNQPGWFRDILFWHYELSIPVRFWLFVLSYAGTLLSAFLVFRKKMHRLRPILIGCGIATLLLVGSLSFDLFRPHTGDAVVVANELMPYKGNSYYYEPALASPLHAGTEVICQAVDGAWARIKLDNGVVCWAPAERIEVVADEAP